ncbi:hypothetical protein TNCV_1884721 [Trichonephila clavipes]|nr:hypothetical protein TNCV_1884721 [Trichonephila clavipes]
MDCNSLKKTEVVRTLEMSAHPWCKGTDAYQISRGPHSSCWCCVEFHRGLPAIGVSSRPKLTGIVRGKAFLHVFAQTSDRLPRLTQTYPIMPDMMDMIESDID